jgi:hypothetical protein
VGVLSTPSHPLLPYFLEGLEKAGTVQPVLMLDAKNFTAKDQAIFDDRTGGAFPRRPLEPFLERHPWTMVPSHNAPECLEFCRASGVGVAINAGTPRRVGPELLGGLPGGIVNVHPGLLPKYRGASCCEWAIYHDDPVGVTAHFMDAGLDSGPIISRETLEIRRGQSYTDVRVALYELELETRVAVLQRVVAEGLRPGALPRQPDGPVFRPMPPDLLEIVRAKLADGQYRHDR